MILAIELQRQFPVGDVPPGAVERGCVLSALTLAEDKVAVGGAAESGGAGDHVHGIIVIHLPQMMHQQNGDAVLVRQRFQNADIPVVAGIRIRVIARGADALERVDDDEPGLRMLLQELLDLFHQPVVELLGHDGEVQRGRRVLREIKEAALDTLEAVLQTEVQHLAWPCGERPERLALRGAETQPQRQPRFADLRRACQQVQSLREQIVDHEGDRFVSGALQRVRVNGLQRTRAFYLHENFLLKKYCSHRNDESEKTEGRYHGTACGFFPLLVLWRSSCYAEKKSGQIKYQVGQFLRGRIHMGGSVIFYTYSSTLELNGQQMNADHDIHTFNEIIQNFIRFSLSKLDYNSPEEYAKALYGFYNDAHRYREKPRDTLQGF